ncbi:hypothetical protein [Paraburkholderia sp. GAS348]|uniref:hypothetical protein n=1 Tax=Paraburkholderia sp. GAS348 TaxID=3035132 RepID=UPI003D20C84E
MSTTLAEVSEAVFEGRVPGGPQRVRMVQATLQAVHNKLLERAIADDPVEADDNLRCASMWLRHAADDIDRLLADRAREVK